MNTTTETARGENLFLLGTRPGATTAQRQTAETVQEAWGCFDAAAAHPEWPDFVARQLAKGERLLSSVQA
jgi:hypothetical protein